MKKKLLSLIAVSAALATAGSALIACGGDDKGRAKTEVTKEQWAAALSLSNFESNFKVEVNSANETSNRTEEYTFIVGSQKYGDYSMTSVRKADGVIRRASTTMRIVGTDKDAYYDRYSEIEQVKNEDGEWVDGDWKEGQWTVAYEDHITPTDVQWSYRLENVGLTYAFMFADEYDSFEYKNGAYVLKGNKGIVIDEGGSDSDDDDDYSYSYTVTAKNITVKFDGAKLAFVELTMTNHHESTEDGETEITESTLVATIKISYGTQTITAPEGAIPDGEDE
ncbi:MAG: hypothetical protein K2M47_06400 [Clostridiales bacterium]|nr:hypothetical protein [Clostridiales bacterium]